MTAVATALDVPAKPRRPACANRSHVLELASTQMPGIDLAIGVAVAAVVRTFMGSPRLRVRVFDNTILRDRTLPARLGDTAMAVQFNPQRFSRIG